jgi:DNA-binding transcriptional ArsR family regulator
MADSADLFEAISHPTRIRILKILEKHPSSFASLKRELNINSSGNLDHHIKKLGKLIKVQKDGLYGLTDTGKEALVSIRAIRAIEAWRETEKRKIKAFANAPREVYFLTLLELTVGIVAAFSVVWLALGWRHWDFNCGFFEAVYSLVTVLAFLSFFDLWKSKGSGWTLAVVQAVLVLMNTIFPLYYANYLWTTFYPLGIAFALLVAMDAMVLFVAFKQGVRDFFGKIYATLMPRRALIGGSLGVIIGMLEIFSGNLVIYGNFLFGKVPSGPGGAGVAFLYYFSIPAGLLIAVSGVLILLRKYTWVE